MKIKFQIVHAKGNGAGILPREQSHFEGNTQAGSLRHYGRQDARRDSVLQIETIRGPNKKAAIARGL
jgi:hypothetical protein